MKSILKTTMMAALVSGVALSVALPVSAQEAPPAPPAAGGPAMMGPDGMGPMGQPWPQFDLKAFDKDGDGKVTMAEVQAGRAERVKGIDADGDGLLSADEMIAADLAMEKSRIEERVKDRIAAQDANGDGKLSAAEMMVPPGPARLFDRIDANDDGAVTDEELAQAREAMRAKMMERMHDRHGDRGPKDHGPRGHDGQGWFAPAQN
ncbi:EF-hand domain-containing protein [Rhodobacter capsulatus]|uniref:EF-hand domain-containing protein n=1 Tax=Rhodobacter capsulatus TaxID=1061 RepID=UPI0040264286